MELLQLHTDSSSIPDHRTSLLLLLIVSAVLPILQVFNFRNLRRRRTLQNHSKSRMDRVQLQVTSSRIPSRSLGSRARSRRSRCAMRWQVSSTLQSPESCTFELLVWFGAATDTDLNDRGMGWSSIASSGTTPLVQKIAEQGQLAQQVFAFAFESHTFLVDGPTTAPGGELTIGGVDTTKYSGEINWNELSEEGFWEIPLGGVSVDGQDAGISTPKAIIDTGTTLIGLPQSVMSQLYALVPSSAPANLDGNGGYFSFPCEQEVTLSLTFGGITYTMPPSAFNAGTYDFDEYTCLASVFGLNSERYIIGESVLIFSYLTIDVVLEF